MDWVQWAWAPPAPALQARLNTQGVVSIPTTVAHPLAAGIKAEPQRGAVRRGTGCSCAAGGQCRQVRGILFGESSLAALKPGTSLMVSSTINSADAPGHCRGAGGVPAIDARRAGIGRRREKAAAGDMTVMASGSDAAFARLAPVLDAVAGKVYRIGSGGLGSTVKIIHQLLAGVHIAVAAGRWRLPPAPGSTGDDV
ncbi:NAD(P)-binding domain-containing protein [Klebsiella pneumoniae]|nr:NAD(P)-binding domain-containing protein [Klebsiella pneumoniae]